MPDLAHPHNPRTGTRTAEHWLRQRDLLRQACSVLVTAADADQRDYGDVGLSAAEWHRVRNGTAGWPLIVKTAGRLGLDVAIRFGVPDPVGG